MNTPDRVEEIVEKYRNINMPGELLGLLGKSRMTELEANKIDKYVTDWLRSTLTQYHQDLMSEKQALLQSIWDAFKDQSEIGVNHLRVELEAHGINLE